ncbi:MAG: hypothetical protein HC817_06585 [Saprospiraceae bacterium]|nr:hypothetical protein [Saprospiraceae bacterium]
MSGLIYSGVVVPEAYRDAAQYILNVDLKNFFTADSLEINQLKRVLSEFQKWGVPFSNESAFKLAASERIFSELKLIDRIGIPLSKMQALNEVLATLTQMKMKLNVWKSQTLYFDLLRQFDNRVRSYPSPEWKQAFLKLGDLLNVRTDVVVVVA